jgi:hypothetical protein
MSTPSPQSSPPSGEKPAVIKIVSHSDLFYWWPVWAVGFLMALLTYQDGHRMALVPDGTVAEKGRRVEGHEGPRDVLVVPPEKELPLDRATGALIQPHLRMAVSNNLGVVYATVLLLVIFITNVRLRGVWTLVAILIVLFLSVIFALAGWWDRILQLMGMADVHINAFGYLCISTTLFAVWLAVFVFFDRLVYATFIRGQFRMHLAVGAGETAYEVFGMVLHKRRDDLFRHWILGFGSGDLIVRTGGANPQTFELPNVLFVGSKLRMAQQMLQEREVAKAV